MIKYFINKKMIHFCNTLNLYQFDLPHDDIANYQRITYNQLFVDDLLHLLNTKSGTLYTNSIDLDKLDLLKLYNFTPNSSGRFATNKNRQTVKNHELVYGVKTNPNYVINHIDGDPSNNKLSNLELVTNWFNTVLQKKESGLPIGIKCGGGIYQTQIRMPRVNGVTISFGSKDLNYLQNLHYQFGTKSGLVLPERYLKEVPNWLPDLTILFKPEHQTKLEQLIQAHLANQSTWQQPIMLSEGSRMPLNA
jgi:hypothetical protein